MGQFIRYMKELTVLAREMRNNPTVSETILWEELKGGSIQGFDFHRQKPIDRFIADFICLKLNLVIELDGVIHLKRDIIANDTDKEIAFNQLDLNVLRFSNSEVLFNLKTVLKTIESYISAFEKDNPEKCLGKVNTLSGCRMITKKDLYSEETHPVPLSRGDFKKLIFNTKIE